MPPPSTHQLLIQAVANLQGINQTIQGLNNLQTATTNLTTGSAASVGAWSGAFTTAFADIQEAAKKTAEVLVKFMEGFIEKAAELQTEEFPLTQMLKDNGEVAKEVLEGMTSLWQKVGVISNESMASAARSLLLMNIPAENVIAKLIELGKVAIASGEDITNAAAAFQRMRQGAEKDIAPAVRGLGAFGTSSLIIFQALEDHFGKLAGKARISEGELISLFQGGRVTIEDINKALREAAEEGGRFFNVFQEKRDTFNGALEAMKTAWQGFQVQIGTPLLDPLTALIQRITDIGTALRKLGEEIGWRDTLRIAWAVLMDEFFNLTYLALKKIAELFVDVLSGIFTAIGNIGIDFLTSLKSSGLKVAFHDLGMIAGVEFGAALAEAFGLGLPEELEKRKNTILGALEHILDDLKVSHVPDLLKLPPETPEETHRADTAKQLSTALHELELAMNSIRQENALISGATFMGMDEKQVALIANVQKQMENLYRELVRLKELKDVLPLNDPQMAQLKVKIQTAENEFRKLGQQLVGLTHPIQAELQRWANSFGSTAHQIAQTIQGTINVALNSLNQYLITGKFNAQALLQQIVLLGLQLVENLIIQQIVGMITRRAAEAEAVASSKIIAAAWASAATAVTIATEGQAAYSAPGAIAIALGATQAILLGGGTAHEGGLMKRKRWHSGGLAADEVPIIAQEGEIMIRRDVAQAPGMMDFLLGINAGRFHSGGGEFNPDWLPPGEFWGDPVPPWQEPSPIPIGTPPPGRGPSVETPTARDFDIAGDTRQSLWLSRMWAGFGTSPWGGIPAFGPTQIPTNWVNYPGVGLVPMAVPVTPDIPYRMTSRHTPQKATSHVGGVISRFHSGGSVGGGGGGGGIHIYAFTDLKALTRHMASKDGQKIIFDTVKGRRIDLGMK